MEKIWFYALGTIPVIIYALMSVVNKKMALENFSPFAVASLSPLFLSLFVFFIWFLSGNKPLVYIQDLTLYHWKWIALVGIFNACAFITLLFALKYISATNYSTLMLLSPIFAGIFSYFLFKEIMTYHLFVGLIFIGIGIFIALYKPNIL